MDELLKKITPTLLAAAILAGIGAIWRFEGVAAEVEQVKREIEKHYTKKEEFMVVKTDINYIKEKQTKMDHKVDRILEAVRK